ncbi:diguanylate cyclase [Aureimonas sp. AU4]|uniref:GGDEF domain-containing protein n=1 Tax=Aureimonas sp. AU4 TaxID=1638163 RepID=UPI00078280AE|nr:GGDEF domain-containing protein [Aureimonas sp. AU4]
MGEGFAWTIPLTQSGFGILFLLARRAGAAPEAGWWGVAYLLTALAFAVPLLEPVLPIQVVAIVADTAFALAFYHYAGALLARFGLPHWTTARLALLCASIAAPAVAVLWIGSLRAELVASDVTCALQVIVALLRIPLWPRRGLDRALVALSWWTVADNLLRTASIPLTAGDATFETFLSTEYDTLMQVTALVTGFAFAILALATVVSDVISAHRQDALADPLTGLLNRRGLEAIAGEGRAGRPDSVVCCDLDHFKRVNDSWGHEVGDNVLTAFADLVRRVLPRGGVAARVGGEEFVLYLPGHSLNEAATVATRLRAAMMGYDWTGEGMEGCQTASFGLGVRLGEGADETLAAAIRRADARLYEAKRGGRDQIRGQRAA